MKNLWKHFVYALWEDEAAVKRWFWGFVGFLATLAAMVLPNGVGEALLWTRRQWIEHVFTALVALVFSMVNPTAKIPRYPSRADVEPAP